jgi:hypothetical protein
MVKVDISHLCAELRPAILDVLAADNSNDAVVIVQDNDIQKIKQALERALPADYVVAENTQDPEELAILKNGDLEQLSLYFCSYCAMVFGSETERNLHQRVHFFGFG